MKNISSVNKIASAIEEFYGKYKNYDGFNILLLTSRIEEDDAFGFFVYSEGDNSPIDISYQKLKEKLLLDDDFFLKFATNLFYSISDKSRLYLQESLAKDGYLFDNKKGFYSLEKESLSDADRQLLSDLLNNNKDILWHCPLCRRFLDNLDSIDKIEKYLADFNSGKYKNCDQNRHPNIFTVKNGSIIFSNLPIGLEKAATIKKPALN